MTRNEAREHWAASGLGYDVLTKDSLERLRKAVNAEMQAAGLIRGTFRAARPASLKKRPRTWADIRCTAYYFKNRQAITFEPDGFVGFAGWADDENVQPILTAFTAWVDGLRN